MSFGLQTPVALPPHPPSPPLAGPGVPKQLKPGVAPANSTATTLDVLVADHNALITALKTAGFLA